MRTIKHMAERARGLDGKEGRATKTIEEVTAGIPSSAFLILAGGAVAGALALKLAGKHATANFVGEWVPTILMLGVYNKLVKLLGSERHVLA